MIDHFSQYVERMLPLNNDIDTNEVITGVVLSGDELIHVPTRIVEQNNQKYATVNSLTNSTYTLVKHVSAFQDMNGSWAKSSVENMSARLIIQGTGNGKFEPSRSITRAEFASIITKGLGLKPSATMPSFSDVSTPAWYGGVISTAVQYQLVTGFADGSFRPQQQITRAEAMVVLSRAMKLTGLQIDSSVDMESALQPFADQSDLPSWAHDAAVKTVQSGLFTGQSDKLLAPQKALTRAEAAALLERLLRQSGLI